MNLSLIKWLLNSSTCQHHREGLLKHIFLGSTPKFSDLVNVGWIPRIWISNKFLSDVHVTDLENSILWAFWICRLSGRFGNFLATISPNIFFLFPPLCHLPQVTHILGHMKLFHSSLVLCSFFFSLWFHCFISVSTIMSSSSLVFSLEMPNLLLVPLSVVFISNTVPSFFKYSIWVFYIFHVSTQHGQSLL